MPLPRHSRSGRRPHCSDANSVPVRPKPVATSSQISSTSCVAARGAEPGEAVRVGELHAGRALHERLDDHGRELARVRVDHRDRDVEAVRVGEVRRAQHREAQRIEDVGAEAVVADRQRADRVAVVRAAEREERRARLRRGSSSTGTRSSAPARPPTRRRTRRGSADRRPARRARAPPTARRRRGCRCRASSSARRARAAARIASSSSGTQWPSVVTHSDEIASR